MGLATRGKDLAALTLDQLPDRCSQWRTPTRRRQLAEAPTAEHPGPNSRKNCLIEVPKRELASGCRVYCTAEQKGLILAGAVCHGLAVTSHTPQP